MTRPCPCGYTSALLDGDAATRGLVVRRLARRLRMLVRVSGVGGQR